MQRNALIDALKVVASQLIVLHHLSAYGPLSDAWQVHAQQSGSWLFDYGRMAVQIFLVVSGFLCAKAWATKRGGPAMPLTSRLLQRYLRLAVPFVAAIVLAIGCAMLARHWSHLDFVPDAPGLAQLAAHVLLVQSIFDQPSLSAGVWYVAIDFQLFALFFVLVGPRQPWAWLGVFAMTLASLFYFNRNPDLDAWGIYFFGAYGMGAAAYGAAHSRRPILWLILLALVGTVAVTVDYRERIVLATLTALVLGYAEHRSTAQPLRSHTFLGAMPLLTVLGNASYALFLVHFSIVMLANALYVRLGLQSSASAAAAILGCWIVSNALGVAFEKWVERPLQRWQSKVMSGLPIVQPTHT